MNIVAVMWDVNTSEGTYLGYVEEGLGNFEATTPKGTTATLGTLANAADWLQEQHEGAGNQ